MASYLTEHELVDRYRYYILELESILSKSQEEFMEISQHLPMGIHTNNSSTIQLIDVNEYLTSYVGYSREELKKMGIEYFEENMHPHFRNVLAPKILNYMWNNLEETVGFVQYLHLFGNQEKYCPLLTFSKIYTSDPSLLLCVDLLPSKFHKAPAKIERVIEMDEFKLKHLNQFQKLTERERQILTLLAEGLNNPRIADRLFISRQTVETHRKNINRKLGIRHYRDVVQYALAFDLINL